MSGVHWEEAKSEPSIIEYINDSTIASSTGDERSRTVRNERSRPARVSFTLLSLSFLTYGIFVSSPVTNLCNQEIMRGTLCAQAVQYIGVMFSGMLTGVAVGPWLEDTSYRMWLALRNSVAKEDAARYLARYLQRVSVIIVLVACAANVLALLPGLNEFVDLHSALKDEIVLLTYAMGILAGAAWFMVLHRRAGWGLVVSCAMSLMIVGNILSIHSWS